MMISQSGVVTVSNRSDLQHPHSLLQVLSDAEIDRLQPGDILRWLDEIGFGSLSVAFYRDTLRRARVELRAKTAEWYPTVKT